MLTPEEMEKVQTYLQQLFWNPEIRVQKGEGVQAPAEVFVKFLIFIRAWYIIVSMKKI